jgi:Na+-driven multidrug efflux pump
VLLLLQCAQVAVLIAAASVAVIAAVVAPQVAVLMGTVVMLVSSCVLLLGRNQLGRLFSSEHDVVMLTAQAVPPLAVSLIGEA